MKISHLGVLVAAAFLPGIASAECGPVGGVYVCTGEGPLVETNPKPGYVVSICPYEYIGGDDECEGGKEIKVPSGYNPKVNDGFCVSVGRPCTGN